MKKIKRKLIDGNIMYGLIDEDLNEILPFVYDDIRIESSTIICKKDGITLIYIVWNDSCKLVYELDEDYVVGEILDKYNCMSKQHFKITNSDGMGLLEVDVDNGVKIVIKCGEYDDLVPVYENEYTYINTIRKRKTGDVVQTETGRYNTYTGINIEPCLELKMLNHFVYSQGKNKYCDVIVGKRYSEKNKKYLSFLAQMIDNKYVDLISEVNGEIDVVVSTDQYGREKRGFDCPFIGVYDELSKECTLIGYYFEKDPNLDHRVVLKEGFRYKCDSYERKFDHGEKQIAVKVKKSGKEGLIYYNTAGKVCESQNDKKYRQQELLPCIYSKLEWIDDRTLVGTKIDCQEIILLNPSNDDNNRFDVLKSDGKYIDIKSDGNFFICKKENGFDILRRQKQELVFVERDIDSIERFLNYIKILKGKEVKLYYSDVFLHRFYKVSFGDEFKDSDVLDIIFDEKNTGSFSVFFKQGTLIRYENGEQEFKVEDCNLNPYNTKFIYTKNSLISKYMLLMSDGLMFYSRIIDENMFTKRLFKTFESYDKTLVYSEEDEGKIYTTISTYDNKREKETILVHDEMNVESSIIETPDYLCGRVIVSKVDHETGQKVYAVAMTNNGKYCIDFNYLDIKFDKSNEVFVCTAFDGKTYNMDLDGFIVINEEDKVGTPRIRTEIK